jgi:NAD(P)-dependent dehydrogenase (short-subunit alcohol dehydrogenase family)
LKFQGKAFLITGASSGIGRQIALDLAEGGAQLIILGRNLEKLEETKRLCPTSSKIRIVAKDFNDHDFVNTLSFTLDDKIDGVVFNAGKVKVNPVAFINDSDINDIFDTNTKSNMLLTQFLLRKNKLNKNSSLVFVSSISTRKPTVGNSVYNASKSALNGFAHSLALEVSKKCIRVNTVLPGFVETHFLGRVRTEEEVQKHLTEYPLGRFGKPTDISSLVCFLLSEEASWITGAQIPIDGGFSLK